jgi:hypothetical protein
MSYSTTVKARRFSAREYIERFPVVQISSDRGSKRDLTVDGLMYWEETFYISGRYIPEEHHRDY